MRGFISNRKFQDLFLLFILGLTPLLWYKPRFLALGHDMSFLLNPLNFFWSRLYLWTERLGFGFDQSAAIGSFFIHSFEMLGKSLGLSLQTTQKIDFIFWFVVPGLAMYYFVSSLNIHKFRFLSLIASVFYMFNHFLLQGWFMAERTKFSMVIALPLTLSFLIRGLQQRMTLLKTAVLINLTLFFFNGGGGEGLPIYGGLIISFGVCLIYFILIEWQKTKARVLKRAFFLVLLILFLFITLNFYWILPLSRFVFSSYSRGLALSGGVTGVLNWVGEISKHASFINLFRLQGIPDWYDNLSHPYANLFLEPPLLIISFLWPLLAFISILLAKSQKEKKYVLFFILLVLISMVFTAGTHSPTGRLYEILIRHIPFFAIFRTPFYKFGYATWFAYAFLISFTVNKLLMKFKRNWVYSLLSFIFIFFILFYNYPFFTGGFFKWNPPLTTMVQVPSYVFEFGNWADSLQEDGRILMIPSLNKNWGADTYNWKYFSLTTIPSLLTRKPVVANSNELNGNEQFLINTLYSALWNGDDDLAKRIIRVLNIKYFLLRKDVFFDLEWCQTAPPYEWQKKLENLDWVKLDHKFGEWFVYRLGMSELLPHFYLPKKFTYVQGTADDLTDMVSFGDWGERPEIYFAENADNPGKADSIFVAGQCMRCSPLEEPTIELPYVWFLPDSVFYPLVEWKETRWEKKIKAFNDPVQNIDLDLGLATKKLAELKKIAEEEKSKEEKDWIVRKIMKKYQKRIENVSYLLGAIEEEGGNINEMLLRIGDYFEKHKKVLADVRLKRFAREANVWLENVAWELDDFLIRVKNKQWVSEEYVKRYFLDIAQKAEYELLIKNEGLGDYFIQDPLNPVVFELDGKQASNSGKLRDDGWILVDKIKMEKGEHKLAVILPEARNLVEKENLFLKQKKGERGKASFSINNFDYTGVYKISFDYKVSGERPAEFMVTQDTDKKDEELGRFKHDIITDLQRYNSLRTFKAFFEPEPGAREAALEFIIEAGEDEESILKAEKIRVERVWGPKVIMGMVNNDINKEVWTTREVPKIAFRKINPTRYEVEVEEAKKPYTLVFSESFNKGWKAYIQTSNIQHQAGDEIAGYFNGEIKEGVPTDNFWPKSILGNWDDKPIPEDRHILANGYANSWHITPEDSGGRENYKLIIEFWPQRLFYMGMAVSALSFMGCLGYLAWLLIKKKKQ